jgi:hypothetical protein
LVRSGGDFSAFTSTDGVTWDQLGDTQTVAMSPTALAGLAVTAHDDTALAAATFTDVSLLPGGGAAPKTGSSGQGRYAFSDIAGQLVANVAETAPPAGRSINLVRPSPPPATGSALPADLEFGGGRFVAAPAGDGHRWEPASNQGWTAAMERFATVAGWSTIRSRQRTRYRRSCP